MSDAECPVVTSSRPEIPEWSSFVNLAQAEMAFSGSDIPTQEVVNVLFDEAATLDNETLENLRYYSLGLVMCGIARALHNPDIRQGLVSKLGTTLNENRRGENGSLCPSGLAVQDISTFLMNMHFGKFTRDSCKELPRGTVLAMDVINKEANRREGKLLRGGDGLSNEYHLKSLVRGDYTSSTVSASATSAATAVLKRSLGIIYDFNHPPEQDMETERPRFWHREKVSSEPMPVRAINETPLADIIDEEGLKRLKLEKVAQRCATLRLDEFTLELPLYLGVDRGGNIFFNKNALVKSSDLAQPDITKISGQRDLVVLHNKRLKCPALFVNDLIPMMINLVVDAVIDGQAKAVEYIEQERIRNEAYRRDTYPSSGVRPPRYHDTYEFRQRRGGLGEVYEMVILPEESVL